MNGMKTTLVSIKYRSNNTVPIFRDNLFLLLDIHTPNITNPVVPQIK